MAGRVIRELRGSGGFGYDVLFVADEHAAEGPTTAELDPAEKDAISHRGRALREIAPRVAEVARRRADRSAQRLPRPCSATYDSIRRSGTSQISGDRA